MQLSSQQALEVYLPLVAIASRILRSTFPLSHEDAKDLAHEYVLYFLYESKSFSETYDEEKSKGLFAYFGSYMRKSALSLHRKRQRRFSLLDATNCSVDDESFSVFEFKDLLEALHSILDKVYIIYGGKPVSCQFVLKGIVQQVLNGDLKGGRINKTQLCKCLGLKKLAADKAISKMREVLHGRV